MLRTFISFDNPPPLPVYLLDPAQSDISAGGRRGEGVPSPMFTVTYPLILYKCGSAGAQIGVYMR